MNEKIEGLARRSGDTDENGSRANTTSCFTDCFTEQELKEFAELIIHERTGVHIDDYGVDIIGKVLKKHFGVE